MAFARNQANAKRNAHRPLAGGSLNYDELVVYEEDAVWPYAIVTYKFLKKRGIEEKKEEKEKGERSIPGTTVEETVQEGTPPASATQEDDASSVGSIAVASIWSRLLDSTSWITAGSQLEPEPEPEPEPESVNPAGRWIEARPMIHTHAVAAPAIVAAQRAHVAVRRCNAWRGNAFATSCALAPFHLCDDLTQILWARAAGGITWACGRWWWPAARSRGIRCAPPLLQQPAVRADILSRQHEMALIVPP